MIGSRTRLAVVLVGVFVFPWLAFYYGDALFALGLSFGWDRTDAGALAAIATMICSCIGVGALVTWWASK